MKLRSHVVLASAFLAGFAAALCLGAINGCARFGNNLAIVNGQVISMGEFYQYLQHKSQVKVQTESGVVSLPVSGSLGFQTVQDLLNRAAEAQIAKDKGLYPSEADLDAELKRRLALDPSYEISLIQDGYTVKAVKGEILAETIEERLLTQGVSVSPSEIDDYIQKHPYEFVEPARARFAFIFVQSAGDKVKINSELAKGQAFDAVAINFSQTSTAHTYDGMYSDPGAPAPAINSLPTEIQAALSKLKADEMSDWFAFNGGFARLFVEQLYSSRPLSIDAAKRDAVRRKLLEAKGAQVNDVSAMVQSKLAESKVDILPEAYRNDWKSLQTGT